MEIEINKFYNFQPKANGSFGNSTALVGKHQVYALKYAPGGGLEAVKVHGDKEWHRVLEYEILEVKEIQAGHDELLDCKDIERVKVQRVPVNRVLRVNLWVLPG